MNFANKTCWQRTEGHRIRLTSSTKEIHKAKFMGSKATNVHEHQSL